MRNEIVYVVGDKYEEFAKNEGVITISEAEKLTNIFRVNKNLKKIYRIGQGVSPEKVEQLNFTIQKNYLSEYFEIENSALIDKKEMACVVHKRKEENVMITTPVQIAESHYKSFLLIHDNCAENSDHITGQHIQGMILIEAARQMMLAVTENYLLLPPQQGRSYFTLNKIATNFVCFAFPVEAAINYQIVSLNKKQNGSLKSTCKVLFEQLGKTTAEIEIEFSVYSKNFIENIEKTMALDVLKTAVVSKVRNVHYLNTAPSASQITACI